MPAKTINLKQPPRVIKATDLAALRERIKQDLKDFRKNGGRVTKVGFGLTGHSDGPRSNEKPKQQVGFKELWAKVEKRL